MRLGRWSGALLFEMSCYPVANKITSICADFLVELSGFELMAIAACRRL
jgi:hypothetical protein